MTPNPQKIEKIITKQFADEWLRLERLKVVDVFSGPDEDDGTPGGCHADGKQQQIRNINAISPSVLGHHDEAEDRGLTRSELHLL